MVLAGNVMALYMWRNFRMGEMRPVPDRSLCGTNASHASWSHYCICSSNWQQFETFNSPKQNQDFLSYLNYKCLSVSMRTFFCIWMCEGSKFWHWKVNIKAFVLVSISGYFEKTCKQICNLQIYRITLLWNTILKACVMRSYEY